MKKDKHFKSKRMRGKPVYFENLKQRFSLTLDPDVVSQIDREAKEQNTSRSQFIEDQFRERYGMPTLKDVIQEKKLKPT